VTDLPQILRDIGAAVDETLDELLPDANGPEARLIEAMRYAALPGGKRLRPFLLVASADMFGVARSASLRAAAAIEFVHTYSLIHDDLPCMDDDRVRRGRPATHVRFDEATATLAGDALQTLAFEILASDETHTNPDARLELIRVLSQATGSRGMAGGQMIDIAAEGQALSIPEITRLQHMKTGALIACACESGAILGRAPVRQRAALHAFAHDLGLVFQITDDLLDAEGDESAAGKAVRKDCKAGKATFVTLLGEERARQQAQMLSDQSIAHLDCFDSEADLLRAAAKFVIKRDA
jgi:farnesyl diphosphate synthase